MQHKASPPGHTHAGSTPDHAHHHSPHAHGAEDDRSRPQNLSGVAFRATLHCLSGCAVGEVLGMVIGTAMGLSNAATIAASIVLAFLFGYAFTVFPLLRSGMALRSAVGLALAADTISIAIMELVDNAIMFIWPGAMDAALGDALFWIALAASLVSAGVVAYPANRWLISRGRGHALAHGQHRH
jgi:hypothetical protein